MSGPRRAKFDDREERLQLRVQMITAGVCVTVLLCLALGVWITATWSHPHRDVMAALWVMAVLGAIVVAALPAQRIVASRFREAFFLTWSLLDVALILALAWADGGVGSPAVTMLFLTLIFAALSYPLASMAIVAATTVLGVTLLGLVAHGKGVDTADPAYLLMLVTTLALTGLMCVWQSRLQQRRHDELSFLSQCDPLTGCLNRRGFAARLHGELSASQRDREPLALIQLDLNGFKAVNDEHGHDAGDELLRWTAGIIAQVVRPEDAVARLGGDEFAVILPHTSVAQGEQIAGRITAALAERIGAAAGVAGSLEDGHEPDALHRSADQRLYAAKPAARKLRAGFASA